MINPLGQMFNDRRALVKAIMGVLCTILVLASVYLKLFTNKKFKK